LTKQKEYASIAGDFVTGRPGKCTKNYQEDKAGKSVYTIRFGHATIAIQVPRVNIKTAKRGSGRQMDYREIVKKVVMRFGHDKPKEDREDFTQECEVVLLQEQETIDKLSDADKKKYIYIICKNRIINLLKKHRPVLSLTTEEILREAEQLDPKELDIDTVLDAEKVTENLNKLPEPYATILAFRYGIDCDPRPLEDIAARFCKSTRWVQKKEKEALERLREIMTCH
jgi:RNA polymerase sigma factor (sigma-70 family)